MHQYMLINKIGEGAFSEVLKSQSLKTGNTVAIKCMKNQYQNIEQVQRLKEIQALKKLSPHPHIVKLIEVLYDEPTGRLALVFELMEQNLFESINHRKNYLNPQKVKHYMYQVLKAVDHMHKNGIFHRDIKPENILLNNDHVKLADLGSCKGIHSQLPYTEYISTRWYRAPECLMTDGHYDYKMDLWGIGAVMFEIISLFPLFPGDNELDQVHKIHNILGTPDPRVLEGFQKHASHMEFNFPTKKGTGIEKLLPNASKDCIDLLYKLLTYDPQKRITADEALKHEYFKEFHQLEQTTLHSTFTSLKVSPSQVYRKSLEPSYNYDQMKNNNNNISLATTQKGILQIPLNSYQQTQISLGKKTKKSKWPQKHQSSKIQASCYPQTIKLDVKIHHGFEDDEKLPPIRHQQHETKINLNFTVKQSSSVIPHLNNPYLQSQHKPQMIKKAQKSHSHNLSPDSYLVLGKKVPFS